MQDVTWMELVVDFQKCTQVAFMDDWDEEYARPLARRALRFKTATEKFCRHMKTTVSPKAQGPRQRCGVPKYKTGNVSGTFLDNAIGLPGRPVFVDARTIDSILALIVHDFNERTIKQVKDPPFLAIPPAPGEPLWWDLCDGYFHTGTDGAQGGTPATHASIDEKWRGIKQKEDELKFMQSIPNNRKCLAKKIILHNRAPGKGHLVKLVESDDRGEFATVRCTRAGCSSNTSISSFAAWIRRP